MHQGVIVFDAVLLQQLVRDVGELPPRRDIARGALAGQCLDQLDALYEHVLLLLRRHRDRILMRIPMCADLMSVRHDHLHLFGECLNGVSGGKPRRLDVVLLKELEQTRNADLARKKPARNIIRGVFAAIGSEPARHGVNIYTVANENLFLCHCKNLLYLF